MIRKQLITQTRNQLYDDRVEHSLIMKREREKNQQKWPQRK